MKKKELKLSKTEILSLIAETCHRTYMIRRSAHKGIPIESIPKEVTSDDRERAEDAWKELRKHKGLTREQAISLVATSSHKMWLKHAERDSIKTSSPMPKLDLSPNEHDYERAEDIIKALEAKEVLHF